MTNNTDLIFLKFNETNQGKSIINRIVYVNVSLTWMYVGCFVYVNTSMSDRKIRCLEFQRLEFFKLLQSSFVLGYHVQRNQALVL